MSDFLVSEILVLILLIPPCLRPFSKGLKKAGAVPLLPWFAAVILLFIMFGQGITVSLLPVIAIAVICIITEFARFVMFLNGLPNGFYSGFSYFLRIFMLILLGGVFFCTFYFSPERDYPANYSDFTKEDLIFNSNGKEFCGGVFYKPQNVKNEHITVAVLSAYPHCSSYSNTFSRFFANAGYNTVELTNPENINIKFLPKRYTEFLASCNAVLKRNGKKEHKEKQNPDFFNFTVSEILNLRKNSSFYVIAEGRYRQALYDYFVQNPGAFSGIFFILSEEEEISGLNRERSCILDERGQLKFSHELSEFPVCLFIRPKEKLSQFGELRCDDVLAARLLGASRDLGRKDRITAAEVFEKWLKIRDEITIGHL